MVRLALTDEGRAVAQTVCEALGERLAPVLEARPQDQDAILDGLEKLAALLHEACGAAEQKEM